MSFWERISRAPSPPASRRSGWGLHLFGKVPAQGDFLRLSLPEGEDPALIALEDWVARGVEETSAELAKRWPALLADGAPIAHLHRLALDGGERALVAAASIPSADAIGRRYPLVACARLPARAFEQTPHLAPIALSSFLREAVPVLGAVQRLPAAEARRLVSAARLSPLPAAPELVLPFELWAKGTTLGRCALELFGADVGELARAIACVFEALAPLRGQDPASTPLALRCPVAVDPHYAAWWIDVVRRVARWRTTVPTYLVSGDDARGSLVIALGDQSPPALLGEAFGGVAATRSLVCDVETTAANRAALPPHVRALLAAPDATLDRLAAALTA